MFRAQVRIVQHIGQINGQGCGCKTNIRRAKEQRGPFRLPWPSGQLDNVPLLTRLQAKGQAFPVERMGAQVVALALCQPAHQNQRFNEAA
jgi:hypothetical protein